MKNIIRKSYKYIKNKIEHFFDVTLTKDIHQFKPAIVAIQDEPASPVGRLIAWILCLIILISIIWSCFARIDIISTSQGQIVPIGNTKVIQSHIDATINKIYIKEGDFVKKGDILIDLDSAFKAFYRVYKLNPNYQSGSSIALSTRTMELVVNKNISNNTGYSLILYLSFIIPGLAICCIIYNYSNYIEIYKSFANIDPKILVDSLRLFFLSLASSLIMSSLFILLDKYSDYRLLSFKYFIDEYAFIIHKKFYSKEYDIEN